MKLSELKKHLSGMKNISFQLPNGEQIPSHFHVTEVGKISRHFIDCGGTERNETVVNFQLWNADDYDHRLNPEKLVKIIELSEMKLGIDDSRIEVEYQAETIGKYGLDFNGTNFLLTNMNTDCLAKDQCGVPSGMLQLEVQEAPAESCCSSDENCC